MALAGLIVLVPLFGCHPPPPEGLGVRDGRLAPCPGTPNCVSTDAAPEDGEHSVPPFTLRETQDPWPVVAEVVENLARTRVVSRSERYLHAEVRSRIFRFVDDLELHYRPDHGVVAVRSASRVGRGDLGVNRRRVEALRRELRERGVVR